MKIGDVRVVKQIHPDSIGVEIWKVEQVKKATGKYAKQGQIYWSNVNPNIEPFTSEVEAMNYANHLMSIK